MAVKWIWGFETGADETFYSGSGWSVNRYQTSPTGTTSFFYGQLQSTKAEILYDYKYNFPHQPPSLVGGGQYSLKVNPAAYYQTVYDSAEPGLRNLWMSTSPMAIMTPPLGATNTATISFSIYCDLEVDQWPFGESGFAFTQRLFSLYPQETTTSPLMTTGSSYQFGTPQTASGDIPNNLPTLPPQLSLFLHASGSTPGAVDSRIIAVCTTGTISWAGLTAGNIQAGPFYGNTNSVPENARYANFFQHNAFASYVSTFGAVAVAPAGQNGFWIYTGSAGDYIRGDRWTEVTVQYIPDKTAGAIRVYLDGVNVINVEGVPTAYTSSYDWDTGLPVNENLTNTGRIEFSSSPFWAIPGPNSGLVGYSSSIEPASFIYDHVVMFDEAGDLSTATSSIFIDRFVPDQDISTGSYVGNDSGTADLYDYIDDTNYYLNNSYLRTDNTASDRELKVSTTGIYETKAGHPTWSVGNISEIIGLNSINLVSSSADLGLYGASLMWDAGLANDEITGPYSLVSGKKFIESVSGETALGASWNYLTGNSGGGPGSQILHSGFKFGPLPESYTVTLAGGNLRFDSWASEISMFIKESGSGDILVTWPGGAALNDPVTWTWNTADALKDFVGGDTYYLDIQENIGDNFFFGASSSSISFTVENDEISSGFTDPVPTNVGDLFLNISHTVGEAARFYFIYNGTSSAPTNPTPGTSGERYGP